MRRAPSFRLGPKRSRANSNAAFTNAREPITAPSVKYLTRQRSMRPNGNSPMRFSSVSIRRCFSAAALCSAPCASVIGHRPRPRRALRLRCHRPSLASHARRAIRLAMSVKHVFDKVHGAFYSCGAVNSSPSPWPRAASRTSDLTRTPDPPPWQELIHRAV
jgi:hypothetical protein